MKGTKEESLTLGCKTLLRSSFGFSSYRQWSHLTVLYTQNWIQSILRGWQVLAACVNTVWTPVYSSHCHPFQDPEISPKVSKSPPGHCRKWEPQNQGTSVHRDSRRPSFRSIYKLRVSIFHSSRGLENPRPSEGLGTAALVTDDGRIYPTLSQGTVQVQQLPHPQGLYCVRWQQS